MSNSSPIPLAKSLDMLNFFSPNLIPSSLHIHKKSLLLPQLLTLEIFSSHLTAHPYTGILTFKVSLESSHSHPPSQASLPSTHSP
uniref:Uncharacterized protein n=1 Tax=Lotus japonicus TaxID=34305 RepID=I3SDF2_LOTJA|nr:unknown [Lotus japonicus]